VTLAEPRWHVLHEASREAANIAATAIVAAKVYEAFGWVRWSGNDGREYHVPRAEELYQVIAELAASARSAAQSSPAAEVDRRVGGLRFLASADEEGVVVFHLSIGSTFERP
jgi:hypothetical protein